MSLIPMMKLRLAAPGASGRSRRLKELNYIREENGELHIGAATTHYEVESSPLLLRQMPAARRNRRSHRRHPGAQHGHASAAASPTPIPRPTTPPPSRRSKRRSCCAAPPATRTVSTAEFFLDTFTTALEPGEIVTEIIVPVEAGLTGTSYQKFMPARQRLRHRRRRRAHPSAKAAAISLVRIGVTGLSGSSYRADNVEAALAGQSRLRTKNIRAAAALVADGIEASADLHASADYRKHLAAIYAARAIRRRAVEVRLKIAGTASAALPARARL